VCERLFGTTNTRFVHTLAGNTPLTRLRGKVTKGVNPKGQACWTLGALATRLWEWVYEVYDTLDHPALGQSPREAFAAGLQIGGERPQRRIAYDEDFRMLTLPTTYKGTAKLQAGRGVKLHYLYYWSDAFLDPEAEGTQLPVRYDPFDAGIAYAFVKKRWVRCTPSTTLASPVDRSGRSSWQVPSYGVDSSAMASSSGSRPTSWRTFSRPWRPRR
jgi:hypothetical protein